MVDELTMFPDVLYNPVNRMLPDDIRLAAVATPVLSIVEMRLLYPTPDDARLITDPVKATPVDIIAVTRLVFKSIFAPVKAEKLDDSRAFPVAISRESRFPEVL